MKIMFAATAAALLAGSALAQTDPSMSTKSTSTTVTSKTSETPAVVVRRHPKKKHRRHRAAVVKTSTKTDAMTPSASVSTSTTVKTPN